MFGFTSSGVTSDTVLLHGVGGDLLSVRACLPPRPHRRDAGLRSGRSPRSGCSRSSTCSAWRRGSSSASLVLVLRADGERRREAIRGALAALAVVAVPVITYMALNSTVWDRSLWFGTSGVPPLRIGARRSTHPESRAGCSTSPTTCGSSICPSSPSCTHFFHELPAAPGLVQRLHRRVRLARLRLPAMGLQLVAGARPRVARPGGHGAGLAAERAQDPGCGSWPPTSC